MRLREFEQFIKPYEWQLKKCKFHATIINHRGDIITSYEWSLTKAHFAEHPEGLNCTYVCRSRMIKDAMVEMNIEIPYQEIADIIFFNRNNNHD